MIEPDDNPRDEGPWTDGARPHRCGYYVDDHILKYRRQADGSSRSYWACPSVTSDDSGLVLG